MDPLIVFGIQLVFTLIVLSVAAWWYLWPWLIRVPVSSALTALLWIHTLRTLGLTVLVPGVADPTLPSRFALGLAYGDLAAAVLALGAIIALRTGWAMALSLVWLFTVVGVADLINASAQGIAVGAVDYELGGVWFIPTYFVPALWVSHALIVILLIRLRRRHGGRSGMRPAPAP